VLQPATVSGPRIEDASRARLARDVLRFGFLGAMLLYVFVPTVVGGCCIAVAIIRRLHLEQVTVTA